jgi:hypothetical protein
VRRRTWPASLSAPEEAQAAIEPQTETVLVALMNSPADLRRAREEGWYRIPVARAPRPLASDYVAFYLTSAFAEQRWAVRYFAEVLRYELRRRLELLPDEPAHPRAQEWYYCLRLGPLQELEPALPAQRLRRFSFVRTTMAQLRGAADVAQLWRGPLVPAFAPVAWPELG